MSGVAIIRYLLANNASLIAVVPATRIMPGVMPIDTVLPAISVRQISGFDRSFLSRGIGDYHTERVQVTALATTYPQQKSIIALIKNALPATRGIVNGFYVDSIKPDIDGPDLYSENPVIYEQGTDFIVRFIRN